MTAAESFLLPSAGHALAGAVGLGGAVARERDLEGLPGRVVNIPRAFELAGSKARDGRRRESDNRCTRSENSRPRFSKTAFKKGEPLDGKPTNSSAAEKAK